MKRFKSMLIAGMCLGPFCVAAYGADYSSDRPASGSNQSTVQLTTGANMNESYAKKAKEDFQLKKKRLENERDAALTRCANETGGANSACRKQANADFDSKVKQEQLAYEEALRHGPSSGSSSGSSSESGK